MENETHPLLIWVEALAYSMSITVLGPQQLSHNLTNINVDSFHFRRILGQEIQFMVKEPDFDFIRLIRIEIHLVNTDNNLSLSTFVKDDKFRQNVSLFYLPHQYFERLVRVVDSFTT